MSAAKVIQRHEFADYLNCGTPEEPNYQLMGTGFTSLNESPNAQTKTKKYVNEKSSTTTVTQYQTEFPYDADLIPSEDCITTLYNDGRDHKTGSDAVHEYVRVELWDAVEDSTTEFRARKFNVANSVSNVNGDDDIQLSGTLHAIGDPIDGTFDVSEKEFVASTEDDTATPATNVTPASGSSGSP